MRAGLSIAIEVGFLAVTAFTLGIAVYGWATDGAPSTAMLVLAVATLAHARIENLRRRL